MNMSVSCGPYQDPHLASVPVGMCGEIVHLKSKPEDGVMLAPCAVISSQL